MYDGKRTDLTYKQIKMGQDLMLAKGYDPDILFGIVMTESRAVEKCTNDESTARGLGQFLKGTGKWVYEKLLNLGTYNHNYALDGDTNIKMMVSYLDYLFKTNNNNLYNAIQLYRGSSGKPKVTQAYCNSIDSFISMADTSVAKISRGMTRIDPNRKKK
jgi:soluble lytic murein transglycosylase-like protein